MSTKVTIGGKEHFPEKRKNIVTCEQINYKVKSMEEEGKYLYQVRQHVVINVECKSNQQIKVTIDNCVFWGKQFFVGSIKRPIVDNLKEKERTKKIKLIIKPEVEKKVEELFLPVWIYLLIYRTRKVFRRNKNNQKEKQVIEIKVWFYRLIRSLLYLRKILTIVGKH